MDVIKTTPNINNSRPTVIFNTLTKTHSMNPKVDEYLNESKKWKTEMGTLRMIILECGLTEDLKWGVPCYTLHNNNVVLIHAFKEYCAIGFFKGALLKDTNGILIQQTENVQAARQIRFANIDEIVEMEPILKAYIVEAIEVEKAGLKVDLKKHDDFKIPEEFQNVLDKTPELKTAFFALTPGRQRGYILHFSTPKQSNTRKSRIESCTSRILKGKGLNDCVCGLSQKMPSCDGSHKFLGQEKPLS